MEAPLLALTFVSALGAGLIAGLFFAFSVSVMPGLARLPREQGAGAMQAINIAILNPVFFALFFGTAAASLAAGVLALLDLAAPGAAWALAGALLYLVGAILVTAAFNVPLNNALARVPADAPEAGPVWERYLRLWTRWNHLRTVTSLGALTAFIVASTAGGGGASP